MAGAVEMKKPIKRRQRYVGGDSDMLSPGAGQMLAGQSGQPMPPGGGAMAPGMMPPGQGQGAAPPPPGGAAPAGMMPSDDGGDEAGPGISQGAASRRLYKKMPPVPASRRAKPAGAKAPAGKAARLYQKGRA